MSRGGSGFRVAKIRTASSGGLLYFIVPPNTARRPLRAGGVLAARELPPPEAGPHGFPLVSCLRAHGLERIVVAPSKIPRAPGNRVKTNRRDADQLARLHRAGELTAIHGPDPQDEAVRNQAEP